MNDKIKELAEQATTVMVPKSGDHAGMEFHCFDKEKFAELIVRECVTMCDETRADYFKHRKAADDYTDKNIYAEGEAASDIIKYKMKKHFGVNE